MALGKTVVDYIKELEIQLAEQKAVYGEFPDAKWHWKIGFSSKSVNQKYTGFSFTKKRNGLYVSPYCEVEYTLNDKVEKVKIWSKPKFNRLVYVNWSYSQSKYVMKFSRFVINLKNNEFKEDMINSCRTEIMSFIKNTPGYSLDDKHLEPRLKKLLVFT